MKLTLQLQIAITIIFAYLTLNFIQYLPLALMPETWEFIKVFTMALNIPIFLFLWKFIKKDKEQKFSVLALIILIFSFVSTCLQIVLNPYDLLVLESSYGQKVMEVLISEGSQTFTIVVGFSILMIQLLRNNALGKLRFNIKLIGYSFLSYLLGSIVVILLLFLVVRSGNFQLLNLVYNFQTALYMLILLLIVNLYWHELKEIQTKV